MSLGWLIYVVARLDALNVFFKLTTIIFGAATVILFAIYIADKIDNYGDGGEKSKPFLKLFGLIAVIFITMAILLPTSKEAVAIYLIPKIARNEDVQKVPSNAVKFLNIKLEEWLRDVENGKEKK